MSDDPRRSLTSSAARPNQGLLLVMDYAENRADEIAPLAAAIQARPEEDQRPIRLVLLSRGAEDWWTRLIQEDPSVQALFGGARPDTHAMLGAAAPQDRAELFRQAVAALGPKLAEMGYATADGALATPAAERLEAIETNAGFAPGDGYDRPLSIAMAALLHLAAKAPAEASSGVQGLLADILGLERAHWAKLVALPDDRAKKQLGRAVGQVTAVQGVGDRRSAETLLMADGRYARPDRGSVEEVADNLSRLYGRGGPIAQLEPDLIGEHHVGLVADVELLDGCLAWIEAETDPTARADRRRDLLTVLQRASRPEHGPGGVRRACALLDHVVTAHGQTLAEAMVAVMFETPGALLQRLERRLDTLPETTLRALNIALPLRPVSWMAFSLRVAERAAALARSALSDSVSDPTMLSQNADALNRLGIRLSDLGRLEEALTALQEAAQIYRALARNPSDDRPDAFLPDLAGNLTNLGADLSDLGRLEEALTALQEAAQIYRALARNPSDDRPDAFLPDLARSLGARAQTLLAIGREPEAAECWREGLMVIAPFVEALPQAFGGLAHALARDYASACAQAGVAPDHALLKRCAEAIGGDALTTAIEKPVPTQASRWRAWLGRLLSRQV